MVKGNMSPSQGVNDITTQLSKDLSSAPKLLTSQEWYDLLGKHYLILDADGWVRKNYDYSFNKELITESEYNKRIAQSTILPESSFGTWIPQ